MSVRRITQAIVLAVLAALLPAGAANAADSWNIPGHARITVTGHGYGHGHGLSQYGAQRAATKGVGYRQIVKYYYPGTRWGTAKGAVKVLISADTTRDVVVGPRAGLSVRSVKTGRSWNLAKAKGSAKRWRIQPLSGQRSEISFKTSGWHRYRVVNGNAEFVADGKPTRLYLPDGSVEYRGILRSASPSGGGANRDTVNILPLDAYLKGVVPREVPSYWHPQALRAQAIAARTYAAYERAHSTRKHYQICDTDRCQVYGGFTDEQSATSKAIDATRGLVLTKNGGPAFTQFSASSGGWTSAGAFSYLPAKKDRYDDFAGNDYHSWKVSTTDARIERIWPEIGNLTSITLGDRDGNGQWGGRIGMVTLEGTAGSATTSGNDFRYQMDLYSTWFTLSVSDR